MRWWSTRRDPRMLGFAIIVLGYLVMSQALVQFLLARNVERRMDFALSGGAIGICLVLVGSVVLLAASASRDLEVEEQLTQQLAVRVREVLNRTSATAGEVGVAPDVVACTDRSIHRPDCLLIERREDVIECSLEEVEPTLSPCRLCLGGTA